MPLARAACVCNRRARTRSAQAPVASPHLDPVAPSTPWGLATPRAPFFQAKIIIGRGHEDPEQDLELTDRLYTLPLRKPYPCASRSSPPALRWHGYMTQPAGHGVLGSVHPAESERPGTYRGLYKGGHAGEWWGPQCRITQAREDTARVSGRRDAMGSLDRMLQEFARAVRSEDGVEAAKFVKISFSPMRRAVTELLRHNPSPAKFNVIPCQILTAIGVQANLEQMSRQALREPLDAMMASYCDCVRNYEAKKFVEAYACLTTALDSYLLEFASSEGHWVTRPLLSFAFNLRVIADKADEELRQKGKEEVTIKDTAEQLRRCFTKAQQASGNKMKKMATLHIVNHLFKLYFKINERFLCKPLVKAVHSPVFLSFEQFSVAQRVTYKYYVGQLAIFDDNYQQAEADLTYAWTHCHRRHVPNLKRILTYLVPVQVRASTIALPKSRNRIQRLSAMACPLVQLLIGKIPTDSLLLQYELNDYRGIVSSFRSGNIQQLNGILQANQRKHIKMGTFLVLEKLKIGTYRNLLKKVALIHKQREPAKGNQVKIVLFQQALSWLGEDLDLDEVECIVANLIYKKYVKGYLSHSQRTLVLSKQQPFPPLSAVQA
eukprot:scaffold6345_cov376-Prasinococcus_capsulatus_cf.AAC.2